MEGSIMGGPILSAPELELDPSVHAAAMHHHHQTMPHQLQGLAPLSTSQHMNMNQDSDPSLGFDSKCGSKSLYMCGSKGRSGGTSDEDERSYTEDGDCHPGGKGKGNSPWQRVKWTDAMVKLLIHVVVVVGEDGGNDAAENNKRKAGILQKKGKWKSISRLMNERGCYVSPQQCEDKFNDLNKRYKRLNDILGKGIACCVVENPSLLDTMDNLTPKAKDDVRKILSSKQLFYKEICAYHNGCKSIVSPAELEFQPPAHCGSLPQNQELMDIRRHHTEMERDDDEDDEDADDDIDDGNNDDEDGYEDHDMGNGMSNHGDAAWGLSSPYGRHTKSLKSDDGLPYPLFSFAQALASEPSKVEQMMSMQSGAKLPAEQQQFITSRMLMLEEQKVRLLAQALELKQQQFRWERICSKKRRELEQQRLEYKKRKHENERLALQLKQRELEVECKRSEASMNSMDMILERLQSREPIDYNQGQTM